MSPWGHNQLSPPVASVDLHEREDGAIVVTPDFFNTKPAKETEQVIREAWKIVEFSYAFWPKEYEIVYSDDRGPFGVGINFYDAQIYEVSPVDKGASIDTGVNKRAVQKTSDIPPAPGVTIFRCRLASL